jgi:type II secretory pathway component PulC
MIKRTFNSDSYDQVFPEQMNQTPSLTRELIKKFNGTQAQLFFSKHSLPLLSFINLIGTVALLIYVMSQFHAVHQQIDARHSKVSKLESSLKVLQESLESDRVQLSPGHKSKSDFLLETQLDTPSEVNLINDLNIKYLGLIHAGHSLKGLIEVDEVTSFFSKGQMLEGRWLIKSFDHSQMILESINGQQVTILLEK